MGYNGDVLMETVAILDRRIDEEDGPCGDGRKHGVSVEVHGDHIFGMRAPRERCEQNFFDIGLRDADVLFRWNAITVSRDIQQGNGHGVPLACELT